MRIAFTGGGTGGHVTPLVAVAREVKRIAEENRLTDLELFYFGPEPALPAELAAEGVTFRHVAAGKLRAYFSVWNFVDPVWILLGLVEALWHLFTVMPDVVFSKGGYGSFPTLAIARLYRLPVIIHESDAIPGRVHRWAGRWASRVAVSFPQAAAYFPGARTALTGTPIRFPVIGGSRDEAREMFGVYSDRPLLFVIGGSQGAVIINEAVVQILAELTNQFEVIHQVGEKNLEDVRLETAPILEGGRGAYYHPVPFLDEKGMRLAYLLADLIISRAGATSISEIAAWGKPSIIIPIKASAQDHQRANAYAYGGHGAAIVIEEDNLTPSVLLNEIEKLMSAPAYRERFAAQARSFAHLDAARLIAEEILRLGRH